MWSTVDREGHWRVSEGRERCWEVGKGKVTTGGRDGAGEGGGWKKRRGDG
jgi:hypothetical protein